MSEFDKLRALLDDVAAAGSPSAAPSPPAGGTPRGRQWARALWLLFLVVTALDAVYLIVKALPPR